MTWGLVIAILKWVLVWVIGALLIVAFMMGANKNVDRDKDE